MCILVCFVLDIVWVLTSMLIYIYIYIYIYLNIFGCCEEVKYCCGCVTFCVLLVILIKVSS